MRKINLALGIFLISFNSMAKPFDVLSQYAGETLIGRVTKVYFSNRTKAIKKVKLNQECKLHVGQIEDIRTFNLLVVPSIKTSLEFAGIKVNHPRIFPSSDSNGKNVGWEAYRKRKLGQRWNGKPRKYTIIQLQSELIVPNDSIDGILSGVYYDEKGWFTMRNRAEFHCGDFKSQTQNP